MSEPRGSSAALLEREEELGAIGRVLDDVREGAGRILVIEGPPGIGKTRLLWETRRLATEAGFRNLGARCDELEDSIAYGVASQLLTAPLQRARPRERADLLEGAAARTAPLLLGVEIGSADEPSPLGDPGQAMLGGLSWLVDNLAARSPLTLLIDDAQWADRESLRWLNHLEKRIAELPVLIAMTVRRGEPSGGRELLAALAAARSATVLDPSPLSESGCRQVLEARMGDASDGLVRTAAEITGGNPLLLDALAHELLSEDAGTGAAAAAAAERLVPDSLIRTVLLRLRALPDGAVPIAEALTILGEAPAEMVIELAGTGPELGEAGIEALEEAELVDGGGRIAFTHPMIRSTIYEQIAPRRRHRRHVQAAALLGAAGEAPERIAPHLIAAGDAEIPGGAETLVEAGRRVYALGAPEATVRYLLRALELDPEPGVRAEILLQLGAAAIRALDGSAVGHLEAAVEAAEDRGIRRSALMELARARLTVLDMDGAAATFELAVAESEGDRELEISADAELASAELNLNRATQAFARIAARREGLTGETPAERKLLALAAFAAAQSNAPRDEVAELARQALAGGSLIEEQSCGSLIVVELLLALVMTDSHDLASPALDAAIADARGRGWPIGFAMASTIRAWMNLRRGDLGAAERDARAADDIRALQGATPLDPFVTAFLAWIAHWQGDDEGALALIAERCPDPIPDAAVFQLALLARGEIRAAAGERDLGAADILAVGERELRLGGTTPAAMPWRSRAAVLLGPGKRSRELAAEELELARAMGLARGVGIALRAQGHLAEAGDEDEPIALYEGSAAVLREADAKLELAQSLADLGAALRRSRRQREAREPLREAAALAREARAPALAQRAEDELGASGESRQRAGAADGPGGLTPSELRVARMAASGRTNREIAEDLFVTPRTIELHLSRAYRKLDIRSRKELPGALGS